MSDLDRRLARVSGGLSARERVILILRAEAEGVAEDPAWRRDTPDFQVPECNHLVGLANGVNHILVPHATVLLSEVETLEARFQLLAALVGWAAERSLQPASKRRGKTRVPELSPPWTVLPAMAPDGDVSDDSALSEHDLRLRGLAEAIANAIPERWSRLLAQEQVVEEIVREFQDEVVIPDVLRDFLLLMRAKLERLYADAPRYVGELRRPEADETILDMLYRGIEAQRGR